jgi:hypothetical protein
MLLVVDPLGTAAAFQGVSGVTVVPLEHRNNSARVK